MTWVCISKTPNDANSPKGTWRLSNPLEFELCSSSFHHGRSNQRSWADVTSTDVESISWLPAKSSLTPGSSIILHNHSVLPEASGRAPAEGSSQSTEAVAQRFTSSDTTCWDEKYNWAHSFLINRSVAACCREARGGGHWIMTCSGTALPGQTGYDGLYTRADEPHATCTLWHLDVVADVGPVGVLLSYRPCLSQRKAIHTRQTRASAHEASMVTFSRMGAKNIRNSWRHDLQRRTWPSAHFQTWSRRFFSKSSRVIDAINTKLKKQQTQGFQIVPRRKKHIGQLHEGDFGICTTKHSWIIFTMLDLLIFKASRTDFAPRSGSRCWH